MHKHSLIHKILLFPILLSIILAVFCGIAIAVDYPQENFSHDKFLFDVLIDVNQYKKNRQKDEWIQMLQYASYLCVDQFIIGSRHGEKKYETLIGVEEMVRATDMGKFWRIAPDNRTLQYDSFYTKGTVNTEELESYTSHNTTRLDVDGVVKKLLTTDYVKEELEGRQHIVEA